MLSINGTFHESVTLVKHLIAPPRCGLRLRCVGARVGVDQRKLLAIIEKKVDSWAENAPNRHLELTCIQHFVAIGNMKPESSWGTEADEVYHEKLLDPIMTISLDFLLGFPQTLFLSLFAPFERTFFDTTYLKLRVGNGIQVDDLFLPLVDSFRRFVNLEEMCLVHHSLPNFLFPLLQHTLPNSVLLPALQSFQFIDADFRHTSDTLLRLADFLCWRREQGFPVQKINIVDSCQWIDMQYILTHIQDTVVEFDGFNFSEEDNI